ncbi:MAG TPA: hypothetical protein PK529_15080, partial [Verrucomicrobiales bacterium]|nr:hypothetical protein [Verrucomicrobiales bacterium]
MTEPKLIGVIEPETHLTGLRYSPCGSLLAAPSFDGRVRRWRLIEGGAFPPPELPAVTGHNGFVSA